MDNEKYYLQLMQKHGICTTCGEMFSHHLSEPFASCMCGTAEWYDFTPYMKLEQQLRNKRSHEQ
jgi:predicted  nucleic acid-binding Zn-ribbon protein